MIVLDTNVVSEMMRDEPQRLVVTWMNGRPPDTMFVTAVTEAEIRTGIALLPAGRRQSGLAAAAERLLAVFFAGRILPFDSVAAREYAVIVAGRRAGGRPISHPDGQIAAIVRSRGASLATRDVGDFRGCGIDVVDPWSDDPTLAAP